MVKVLNRQITNHWIATTYLWFYRMIGITFGGLSIDSNGRFHINKYLKFFGYFYAIVFSFVFFIGFNYMLTTETFKSLYTEDDHVAHYAVILYYSSQMFHIIINLFYLNRREINFVKIFVEFSDENTKKSKNFVWLLGHSFDGSNTFADLSFDGN